MIPTAPTDNGSSQATYDLFSGDSGIVHCIIIICPHVQSRMFVLHGLMDGPSEHHYAAQADSTGYRARGCMGP